MLYLIIYIFCLVSVIGVGCLAAWSDLRGMTIPNLYVGIIVISFLVAFGVADAGGAEIFAGFTSHLMSGGIVLGGGIVLYALKMFGAGDSKFMAAYALWMSMANLVYFIFYVALAGALVGVVAIFIKKKKPFEAPPEKSWAARLQAGENVVPYGVAITGGAIISFIVMSFISPETLLSFVEQPSS